MTRHFWLLATGTGRCGTGYVAQVLSSCGVKCSHEGVFQRDPVDETRHKLGVRLDPNNEWWGWEAESSWLAAPFLSWPELVGVTVVHLVRHPKSVIDSQMRIRAFGSDNVWRHWQEAWLPDLADLAPVEAAATFYIHWNRMIEPHADHFHRIEDPVLPLLTRLGIDWHDKEVYANTQYNSRGGWGPSDVDLDGLPNLLRSELRTMCEEYGYEWPA